MSPPRSICRSAPRRGLWGWTGGATLALTVGGAVLSGCAGPAAPPAPAPTLAQRPPPQAREASRPASPQPPDRIGELVPAAPTVAPQPLPSLPGWDAEDHLAALTAFRAGCGVARAVEWRRVCEAARADPAHDETAAKLFFERHFMAESPPPLGVLTAYYAPTFPAQTTPDEVFSAPVRPPPSESTDDPAYDLPRAEIEQQPADDALAFMKPEDLFFLQIQGSGILTFPDGRRMKAVYAGDNRRPFAPIAGLMAKAGLLPCDKMSGSAIREWLAAHRGPQADQVMDQNQRYIFFELVADDGREPVGAAGATLTAGRTIAVDPAYHGYGTLYWIDADAPTLRGAAAVYRRLAVALDTGSAIRGERRADLYLGRGEAAGAEAGRVRHSLKLIDLVPVSPPVSPSPSPSTYPTSPTAPDP